MTATGQLHYLLPLSCSYSCNTVYQALLCSILNFEGSGLSKRSPVTVQESQTRPRPACKEYADSEGFCLEDPVPVLAAQLSAAIAAHTLGHGC